MLEVLVAALDGARRALLRRLLRVAPLRRLFVDPSLRIPAAGLVAVATSFAFACWQPLVSLWLGAALFGVPHLVAGVRHVVARERVEPLGRAACVAALGVGVWQCCGAGDGAVRAYVVLFALALHAELAAAPLRRWLLAGHAAVAVAAAAALVAPRASLLVLSHVHGLGALGYFALRARRRGVVVWPVLAAAALVMLGGALGVFDKLWAATLYAPRSASVSIVAEAVGTAFGQPSAVALRRALFLYAFGQSLHFAVWLRLLPELDRPTHVPHSFRRALALFERDCGRLARPALVVAVAAVPAIFCGGGTAREAYFALTYFHVGLEAAVLARALARPAQPSLAWSSRAKAATTAPALAG